jgi:hypothetical protein
MAATLKKRAKTAAKASTGKAGVKKRAGKKPVKAGAGGAKKPERKTEISDGAVEKATGKAVEHWYGVLDRFARSRGGHAHKDAAEHLHVQHGVPEWWCQMVTVLYERVRGHRDKHQRPDG